MFLCAEIFVSEHWPLYYRTIMTSWPWDEISDPEPDFVGHSANYFFRVIF